MANPLFPELIVNGETVPHAVVAAESQNHEAPKGKPGIAWRKAANAVAIRTLLLQEVRNRGLESQPQEVGPGRFETDEEAAIRGLLDQAIEVDAPSDEEIEAEWARDPERFRTQPLWEVSHILCACGGPDDKDGEAKAFARAELLAKEAAAAPKKFPDLAASGSDCGSKSSGGFLGQLGPGDTVPEFEAVLKEMAEGDITETPIRTRHGWHVIRMDAVAEGRVLPFETVRPRISEAMEKARWAAGAQAFISKLVESADISGADFKPI